MRHMDKCFPAFAAAACMSIAFPLSAMNAQAGSIIGRVVDDASNATIANAEVTLTDLKRSTRSDSVGRFLITAIPAGKHAIVVRLVGYTVLEASLDFAPGATLDADFPLTRTTTKLAKVNVVGETAKRYEMQLAEFEERRQSGIGKFLTADIFEKADGRPPSSVIQAYIAGIKMVQSNGRRVLASARGTMLNLPGADESFQRAPKACMMQIIVNNVPRYTGRPTDQVFDFDQLNTADIIGFEFYTVATTPLKYGGTGSRANMCGTVVIWTKGG